MQPDAIALLIENYDEDDLEREKFDSVILDLEKVLGIRQSFLKLLHKTWLKRNPELLHIQRGQEGDWYVILAALDHLKKQGFRKPQVLLTRGCTTFNLEDLAQIADKALVDELPEQEGV